MGQDLNIGGVGSRLVILVDYSNLIYRAFFSCLDDLESRPWLPIVRSLDMLRTCVKLCRRKTDMPISFIFCGDSVNRKLDRMEIDNTYKNDRNGPSYLTNLKFYVFRGIFSNVVLREFNANVIFEDGAEGDDVIASAVANLTVPCLCEKKCGTCACDQQNDVNHIVIFSADRDLNVLLGYKRVTIYRPPSIFYTRGDFIDEFGFHPRLYPVYKALIGDRSNGVKGVPLWGDNRAKIHILKGDWEQTLKKDKTLDKFNHAMDLVRLSTDASIPINGDTIRVEESSKLKEALLKEYHKNDALDEILLAGRRLQEVCENAK